MGSLHEPGGGEKEFRCFLNFRFEIQAFGLQRSTRKRRKNEKVCGVCVGEPNLETTRRLGVDQYQCIRLGYAKIQVRYG